MFKLEPVPSFFEDEPYMSLNQLHYFQNKLLGWRKEVCDKLSRNFPAFDKHAEQTADWVDAAALQTQNQLYYANHDHALRTLIEIDSALQRIKSGTFGFCIESGDEIGFKRLIALPIAKYSIDTQEELEKRNKTVR
ncbi:MAG: TraR/DksA family transcriptional regulator [Deltaproteobacteria bacterium]|jgi:DnaK suppressor protein|nr:TraR/DksA family transcriptional regulator [Deltaproteobacteria bacterium]